MFKMTPMLLIKSGPKACRIANAAQRFTSNILRDLSIDTSSRGAINIAQALSTRTSKEPPVFDLTVSGQLLIDFEEVTSRGRTSTFSMLFNVPAFSAF